MCHSYKAKISRLLLCIGSENKQNSKKNTDTSKLLPGAHLNQRIGNLIVHLLGGLINEVGPVEGELFGGLVRRPGLLDEALAAVQVHGQHHLGAEGLLPVVQGPAPDHHLH